jgi:predicted anti-sigma-YlaC factor YlaD
VTTLREQKCDTVQLAAMARLDGESAPVGGDEYESHLAGCEQCREVIAGVTRLHARLEALSDGAAVMDLWPAVHGRIVDQRRSGRERLVFGVLAAFVLAWRTAQLVVDVPVPVLNAVVPLAVAVLVGWWVAGDPLAIQAGGLEEQQERA